MKRFFALSLALLMVFALVSCETVETFADTTCEKSESKTTESVSEITETESKPTETESETTESETNETEAQSETRGEVGTDQILSEFVDFLDGEGFTVGLWQGAFKDLIGSYSVGGEKIDSDFGMFYDSEFGGGFEGYGEYEGKTYAFVNDFYQDEEKTRQINYLETSVPFEGMELPFGIAFGDDLEVVFEKMGLTYPQGSFVPDEDDVTRMTLLDNGKESLAFVNLHNNIDEPVDYYEPFIIVFIEKYESVLENGKVKIETRRVMLYFSDFGGELSTLYISAGYQY